MHQAPWCRIRQGVRPAVSCLLPGLEVKFSCTPDQFSQQWLAVCSQGVRGKWRASGQPLPKNGGFYNHGMHQASCTLHNVTCTLQYAPCTIPTRSSSASLSATSSFSSAILSKLQQLTTHILTSQGTCSETGDLRRELQAIRIWRRAVYTVHSWTAAGGHQPVPTHWEYIQYNSG